MTRRQEIPLDVLLYVCSYSRLIDVLRLLSTCKTFHRLSESRSLWIDILKRIKRENSQPLACPLGQDLSQLSLSALKQIAHHTIRLEKNWSQAAPEIAGPVRAIRHSLEPFWIFAVIPGTEILLLASEDLRQFVCLNVRQATTTTTLSFVGELYRFCQYDEPGKHLVILVDHADENDVFHHRLHVICVEYGPCKPCTMRQSYQTVVPADCHGVFVHADVLGVFYAVESSKQLFLLAINMETGVSVTTSLDIPFTSVIEGEISCHVQDTHVGLVVQSRDLDFRIYQCSRNVLPFGNTQGNAAGPFLSRLCATIPEPVFPDGPVFTHALRYYPFTSIGFKSIYTVYRSSDASTTISFQPDILAMTSTSPPTTLSVTVVGSVCMIETSSRKMIFSTPSGRYMLICTELIHQEPDSEGNVDTNLHLVHFITDPPSIQVRPLKMPLPITLTDICGVAVDDHLGIVFLSIWGRRIFAVPFA